MSIVNFDIFFNFYLENKEMLFMESGTKDINIANIQKWFSNIEKYSPEELKEPCLFFARTFIEFLLYVSFDDFYKIINLISLEFKKIIDSADYTNIYLFLPGKINKSNLWVALLFIDCLVKNNLLTTEIQDKIKCVNNYNILVKDSANSKSLCLYCDDMSYTGTQIVGFFNKSQQNVDTNIDKYFMISYISNDAEIKIRSSLINCSFFTSTIHVDRYIKQLKQRYNDESHKQIIQYVSKMCNIHNQEFSVAREAFDCKITHIPLYFDHKIADSLSVNSKILFTGAYPTTSDICEINPLINGCSDIDNLKSLFSENPCVTNKALYNSEVPCFPSFYKTIPYVLNGNIIADTDKKNIVDLLVPLSHPLETSSIKGGRQNKSQRKNKENKRKKTNKKTNKKIQ